MTGFGYSPNIGRHALISAGLRARWDPHHVCFFFTPDCLNAIRGFRKGTCPFHDADFHNKRQVGHRPADYLVRLKPGTFIQIHQVMGQTTAYYSMYADREYRIRGCQEIPLPLIRHENISGNYLVPDNGPGRPVYP